MCPYGRDWTELIETKLDVDAKYINKVTSPENGYGPLLYWLDCLDSICEEINDEIYVYIPKYTSNELAWGGNFNETVGIPLFLHQEQIQILDEMPELEYCENSVRIYNKEQPELILVFKEKIDGDYRSVFTTPNLRVWRFVEQDKTD